MAKAKKASYVAIGQIVGPHGIRGEVKVQPLTDFPERFKKGAPVFLGEAAGQVDARPVMIAGARKNQEQYLVLLEGVKDRNAAEALRWQYLLIPEEQIMPLGEHENYLHDLMGMTVLTTEGQRLGVLKEILFTPANDVYVIGEGKEEVLIPATREVVLKVDVAAREMTVALPDGLLAPANPDDATDDDDDADTDGADGDESV